MDDNKILFVDLEGTLIKEDLSNLAFMDYFKKKPLHTLYHLIVFLFKGKPYLKEKISRDFRVPFESWTFNKAALNYVKDIKNRHRVVYLISGSHQILVDQIDNRLKIFFESFGTQGDFNMVGQKKLILLTKSSIFKILIISEIVEKIYLFGNIVRELFIQMFL